MARKKKGGMRRISEKWLYSNIPYTNHFFTKTIMFEELTLQKHRPECYCSDKEATETQHSGPVELRLPLFLIHSKKKKTNRFLHTVGGRFKIDISAHLKTINKPLFYHRILASMDNWASTMDSSD